MLNKQAILNLRSIVVEICFTEDGNWIRDSLNPRFFKWDLKKQELIKTLTITDIGSTTTLKEKAYRIFTGNLDDRVCPICKDRLRKFIMNTCEYSATCSSKCGQYLPGVREKCEETMLERYGVRHAQQSSEIRKKSEQTMMTKYGVSNPMQSPICRERAKQTIQDRYGVSFTIHRPEIKEKIANTIFDRYGVTHQMHRPEIREKIENTNLERYGVRYAMQDSEKARNALRKSYRLKEFILPSGRIVELQGYEPQVLKYLLENGYEEQDFCWEIPSFSYKDNDRYRVYHPDLFLKSKNLIIEVKSHYTYDKGKWINYVKRQAVIDSKFDFVFIIWDQKTDAAIWIK